MKISNFLASLLPSFGKDQVLEDCRITRTEIKETTGPAYAVGSELLRSWKFKSPAIVRDQATFGRMVKLSGGNMVVVMDKSIPLILQNLDEVEELIKKVYNEEVAGAGMTYLSANLLQLVEAAAFVSKFSRKYLIYIYICETEAIDGSGTSLKDSLSPAEAEWLKANFVSFCTAVNILTNNPGQLRKMLDNIPDIVVTPENAKTLGATIGENKIDPFSMRLIPTWMNPIYHIGLFVAEWQAGRYKAAQEELKLIQLRKLNLEKISNGKPDAKIQKEIEYLEARIQGLNYKLAQTEAKYG